MTFRWNPDKPHRCPACHAIAVSGQAPRSWRVYTCCRCGTRFTRWPRLARLLVDAGVSCGEHATVRDGVLDEMRYRVANDLHEVTRSTVLAALTTGPAERTNTPEGEQP